jgi:hypothetical protein
LSKDEILKLREKELQYVSRLNLKRGVYHVRIGVRDLSSDRIGTAIVWLEIPKAGKGPGARPD